MLLKKLRLNTNFKPHRIIKFYVTKLFKGISFYIAMISKAPLT